MLFISGWEVNRPILSSHVTKDGFTAVGLQVQCVDHVMKAKKHFYNKMMSSLDIETLRSTSQEFPE